MKFKRSLWKGEFKSPTNLCCLLKGILRVLKQDKHLYCYVIKSNKVMMTE